MRISYWLSLVAVSSVAVTTPALAQDFGDWSGFYVGGIAGAQFDGSHFSLPGDKHDLLKQNHANHTNFTGGGLAGFNFQSANFVYGIEGEVTGGDSTQSVTACTVPDGCFTPKHDSFTTFNHLKTALSARQEKRLHCGGAFSFAAVDGGVGAALDSSASKGSFHVSRPSFGIAARHVRAARDTA